MAEGGLRQARTRRSCGGNGSALNSRCGRYAEGNAEDLMDPFGLYRQWSRRPTRREGQESPPENLHLPRGVHAWGPGSDDDLWRQVRRRLLVSSWSSCAAMGGDDIAGVHESDVRGGRVGHYWTSTRGFVHHNATNGPLSEDDQEVLENETFLADQRRFMGATLGPSLHGPPATHFGDNLSSPPRSDNTQMARLVVSLDGKPGPGWRRRSRTKGRPNRSRPPPNKRPSRTHRGDRQKLDDSRSDLNRVEADRLPHDPRYCCQQ